MVRIGDAFLLVGGGTPSTAIESYWGAGTPWFSSADIDSAGKISFRRRVTDDGINNSTTNIVSKNTVVVVTRVGLGKVAKLKEDMCFSQDIQALIPKNGIEIDADYLCYQMRFHMQSMKYKGQGTTISGITKKQLSDVEILLPNYTEQRRTVAHIEELFSELDNGVETLRKTKRQLEAYRKAMITRAFQLEQETEWKRLDEISDISGGITKGRDLTGQETLRLPYLRVANVQDGYLDLTEMKSIELKASEKEKYLLTEGDVLYTEGGDRDKLGRGTVWHGEIKDCVHQNHVFKARLNRDVAIPEYVAFWSMSAPARNYFYTKGKQSVNLASINKFVLSALELPVPSLSKQKHIVQEIEEHLSVCNSIEKTIEKALEQADAMRQSILKRSFCK